MREPAAERGVSSSCCLDELERRHSSNWRSPALRRITRRFPSRRFRSCSGGEPAALRGCSAAAELRLLPGVMGDAVSGAGRSFEEGAALLERPLLATRPQEFEGRQPIPGRCRFPATTKRLPNGRRAEGREADAGSGGLTCLAVRLWLLVK
ncbi:hypothetical protein ACVOMV_05470 [Mesorhizobium atlanticum]